MLAKETWNPAEFNNLIRELMGEQGLSQPLPDAEPTDEAKPDALIGPVLPPSGPAIGRPRVLIVENREDWQNIVVRVLAEAGCFWRVARKASEALSELEKESFHLVILDLKLQKHELPISVSEGWLLLDHLVETRPKTKVLVLSGKAGPSDVAELLKRYPIIDYIEKQRYEPQAIRAAVAQATQARNCTFKPWVSFACGAMGKPSRFGSVPRLRRWSSCC